MTNETDPREEIVARAMCEAWNFDPDDIMANDGPRWRLYAPHARAILAALDAARPVEPKSVITWWDRAVFGSALDGARPVEPPDVGLYMNGDGRFYDEGGAEWEITQADYERLTENCQCSHCVARRSARATAAEVEVADLRARLMDFAERLDNSCNALQDIEDPGDGLRHIDRLVLRREVARIGQVSDECTAIASIKEDRT